MNLFVLDLDPTAAARYHSDQHVFKMAVEAAQLLSSAVSVLTKAYDEVPNKAGTKMLKKYKQCDGLYKPTHYNHPCCVWLRQAEGNAVWAYYLGLELLTECRHRGLKASPTAREVLRNVNRYWWAFPRVPKTPHVLAIDPVKYPTVVLNPDDPVGTYRDYYRKGKAFFPKKGPATWQVRGKPEWWDHNPEEHK